MNTQIARDARVDRASTTGTGALQRLYAIASLPEEEIAWHQALGKARHVIKGDAFCEIGQERHEAAIVESGIFQSYMLTSSGDRVVLDFIFPGGVLLALDAAVRGQPSEVCFEALTPGDLIVWPYDLRKVANNRHPGWVQLEARLVEGAYSRKNRRYITTETLNATERLAYLDEEFPPEWRLIPQHILASYLRITPQHLSRLKRGRAKISLAMDKGFRGS